MNHVGVVSCLYFQDIVRYKSSQAYKWLKNLVGDEVVKPFEDLCGIAMHRYGIFIKSFNTDIDRKEQMDRAAEAVHNKEISYEQYMMLESIEDYKKAGMVLAYYTAKAEKKQAQIVAQNQKNAMDLQDRKDAGILNLTVVKGHLDATKEHIKGYWYYLAHKATADADIQKTRDKIASEPMKQDQKKDNAIETLQAKEDIKRSGIRSPDIKLNTSPMGGPLPAQPQPGQPQGTIPVSIPALDSVPKYQVQGEPSTQFQPGQPDPSQQGGGQQAQAQQQ